MRVRVQRLMMNIHHVHDEGMGFGLRKDFRASSFREGFVGLVLRFIRT